MGSDPRHADTVARGDAVDTDLDAEPARATPRARDNVAASATAERERTFTAGDDDPGGAASGGGVRARPAPPPLLGPAIARVRGREERPSPFGVSQFPPLPLPPGMDRALAQDKDKAR